MTTYAPDPILSASLYCAGQLDNLIHDVLRPFWSEAWQALPRDSALLWMMRYGRCGEHLKIRVHIEQPPDGRRPSIRRPDATAAIEGLRASLRQSLRQSLEEKSEEFFASLDDDPMPRPTSQRGMPPVDADDEALENYPDRSVRYTTYRRSIVALGSPPFLDDETYVALFTLCQARACDLLLDEWQLDAQHRVPFRVRFNILAKLLIAGLATLDLDPARRTEYLLYHRDWLIRFPLLHSNADLERGRSTLEHFEQRRQAMAAALGPLRDVALAQWSDDPPVSKNEFDQNWRSALGRFAAHVEPLCDDPAYDVDPFAPRRFFAPIFKVLHGVANQLGLDAFEEAQTYHFLARLTDPEGSERSELAFEPSFSDDHSTTRPTTQPTTEETTS